MRHDLETEQAPPHQEGRLGWFGQRGILTGEDFRILVVDDEPRIRELLAGGLEDEGYVVVTAANGIEALAEVAQSPPNLILLDVEMPEMDGPTFVQALRQQGTSVPVIVVSAVHPIKRVANELGAPSYVAKPFDLDQVLDQVERLFRQWSEVPRPTQASHRPSYGQ